MKKKEIRQKKKNANKLFLALLLLIGICIVIYSLGQKYFFQSHADNGNLIILQPNPDVAHPNLQLRTFTYITIPVPSVSSAPVPTVAPPASGYCGLDVSVPQGAGCQCMDMNAIACPAPATSTPGGVPSCSGAYGLPLSIPPGSGHWFCVKLTNPGMTNPIPADPGGGCTRACIGKPVVYLYPTKKTLVDVSVTTPGSIFVSDPLYPKGGWKNVVAYPNGDLTYQNKNYKELFYETTVVKKIAMPDHGILIPADQLAPELRRITTQLGLMKSEQDEFIDYWVPVLQKLHAPYVYFSILPPEQKEAYDHLTISPQPDTRIEFIAYFKALQNPIAVKPLALPQTPPERKGFTEVEWGGTIGE